MKFHCLALWSCCWYRRAPQGARGLKWDPLTHLLAQPQVAPRKGRVG